MFESCTALTNLTLNYGVKIIGNDSSQGTFENCTALKSIVFPSFLESLENAAFWQCTSLNTVDFTNTSFNSLKMGSSLWTSCKLRYVKINKDQFAGEFYSFSGGGCAAGWIVDITWTNPGTSYIKYESWACRNCKGWWGGSKQDCKSEMWLYGNTTINSYQSKQLHYGSNLYPTEFWENAGYESYTLSSRKNGGNSSAEIMSFKLYGMGACSDDHFRAYVINHGYSYNAAPTLVKIGTYTNQWGTEASWDYCKATLPAYETYCNNYVYNATCTCAGTHRLIDHLIPSSY